MVKITTPNKQGQIVIPIEFRKALNITKDSYLEVYQEGDHICLKPLNQEKKEKSLFINFPKDLNQKPFHFHSKHPEEDNLAGKIDEILYS